MMYIENVASIASTKNTKIPRILPVWSIMWGNNTIPVPTITFSIFMKVAGKPALKWLLNAVNLSK